MGAAILLKDHKIESEPPPLNPKLAAIGSSKKQVNLISGIFHGLKKFTGAGNERHHYQAAEDSLRRVVFLSSSGPY
ncbi:hypothetical protein PTKIN_Ptkin14bG0097200 [Pterospermum kingtungense]